MGTFWSPMGPEVVCRMYEGALYLLLFTGIKKGTCDAAIHASYSTESTNHVANANEVTSQALSRTWFCCMELCAAVRSLLHSLRPTVTPHSTCDALFHCLFDFLGAFPPPHPVIDPHLPPYFSPIPFANPPTAEKNDDFRAFLSHA